MERKERIEVEPALEKLVGLMEKWGLEPYDYILVDEFAYILQGYDVRGPEAESGHLDLYVNHASLPWKAKGERSIIPPKDSEYMNDWTNFMEETGYGLDMLRANFDLFQTPRVEYELSGGKKIGLMNVPEMTSLFVEKTIMHYALEDVGEEKIREWISKLNLIRLAASKKGNEKLAEFCAKKMDESKNRWSDLFPY